jgi:hypothetical protein
MQQLGEDKEFSGCDNMKRIKEFPGATTWRG